MELGGKKTLKRMSAGSKGNLERNLHGTDRIKFNSLVLCALFRLFLIVDIVTSIIYSCLYTIIQIKIDLYIYTYLEVLMYNVFFIKLFVVNTNTSVKSRLDFLGW